MSSTFPLDAPTDAQSLDAAIQAVFTAAISNGVPLDDKRWVIRTDEDTHDWELEIHPVV